MTAIPISAPDPRPHAPPPCPAAPPEMPVYGLVYPWRTMVLVTGVPGAGKSTLLQRLFGLDGSEERTVVTAEGVQVLDSLQSRRRLARALSWVPYILWRWLSHFLHMARIMLALRSGGPVVVHESGTRRPVRLLLAAVGRRFGHGLHIVMIDASPEEALLGQCARGRRVSGLSHRTHSRRWRRLKSTRARGAQALVPGAGSLLVVDRTEADRMARIRFEGPEGLPVRAHCGDLAE